MRGAWSRWRRPRGSLLGRAGLLHLGDLRRAAEQFAHLVAGTPLHRAVLVGTLPPRAHPIACAPDGVEAFLARFGTGPVRREEGE